MTEKVFKRHAVGKPLSQSSFCSNPDEEQSAAAKGSFQDNQPDYEKIRFWRVLLITWMGYAAYVIARKPFSVVRIEVEKEIKMTTMMSSMVDTAFLTTYCFGQIFYSVLKSRCSSKIIIGVGLAGAASCTFLFSSSSNSYFMILLWGLNGIFESFGWPSCVSVVTPWLHPKERGRLMGIWGSCQAVGSLLGNWLVASLLMIGWRQSYVGVTVVVVIVAVLIFFYLYEHPNRAGFVSPLQWSKGVRSSDLTGDCTMDGEFIISEGLPMEKSENTEVELNQITTMQLAKLPAVPDLAMSYFCQKLIRYSLLSWLPYYLTNELGFPPVVAGYVASSFDFGGIIGSIASGLFSDWYKGGTRRVQACVIYLKCGTAYVLCFYLFLFLLFFEIWKKKTKTKTKTKTTTTDPYYYSLL